jgi:hypothetical protein
VGWKVLWLTSERRGPTPCIGIRGQRFGEGRPVTAVLLLVVMMLQLRVPESAKWVLERVKCKKAVDRADNYTNEKSALQ